MTLRDLKIQQERGNGDLWLNEEGLACLAREARLTRVLIRTERGRFTAPAQDAVGLIPIVEAAGWRVRDVSVQGGLNA